MTKFYQCDVAEGNDADGSIWTSSVFYCDSIEEAEFNVMLELQHDWGDGYIPDEFIRKFGADLSEAGEDPDRPKHGDPVFPGVEAWNEAGYFDDIPAKTGMLTVDTVTALAKLGKISDRVLKRWPSILDKVMAGEMMLDVTGVPLSMFEATAADYVETSPECQCFNCNWKGRENELNEIKDLSMRVGAGEVMPAGECPECGCLAYLKKGNADENA